MFAVRRDINSRYFRRCLRYIRYALRTRNTYQLVSQLHRMLFEMHCILEFISHFKRFFIRQCFFFLLLFAAILYFYGYFKHLRRHKRGTKPQIDSLYKLVIVFTKAAPLFFIKWSGFIRPPAKFQQSFASPVLEKSRFFLLRRNFRS